MNSSRSADVVLQGLSVLVEGQVDVRKPEGQPDQSHNQQSDREQDQSWLQQQHRISDEPKQVSSSLNRPALGRVQRVRKSERVEVEPRIDQRENRHSDDNQGELEKNRVDFTGSKARVEKEQQERENRDARPDERHDAADIEIGGFVAHGGPPRYSTRSGALSIRTVEPGSRARPRGPFADGFTQSDHGELSTFESFPV